MSGYRNPVPTVDVIIRASDSPLADHAHSVVLIERNNPPHGWALPGGFVDYGESLEDAARREAKEETGLDVTLERLLYVYSAPDRDPRQHTVSAVFIGHAQGPPVADDDAAAAGVFPLDALPTPLCFDHGEILADYRRFVESGELPTPRT